MPPTKGFPDALVAQALDDALNCGAAVPVLAISGLQGSGKSTLAAQVVALAASRGLRAAMLSIDDVYLTRVQRQRLARQVHPLLLTRGPPGTHDLALAHATLAAVAAGGPVALPRFDKLADERLPEKDWPHIDGPLDLLVFEGWFLGTPAQAETDLEPPSTRWSARPMRMAAGAAGAITPSPATTPRCGSAATGCGSCSRRISR